MNLKFRQKILLAASLVVAAAFSLFTLYGDYQQRNAISSDLDSYLNEMGTVTANNIQNWLSGRILLVESAAQNIASNPTAEAVPRLLEQKALASTFIYTYLGSADATLTGSRLQRVQTDRMLKSVGNSSFRQDTSVHSLGNVVGAKSN